MQWFIKFKNGEKRNNFYLQAFSLYFLNFLFNNNLVEIIILFYLKKRLLFIFFPLIRS